MPGNVNYPAAQIAGPSTATAALSTSGSSVVRIPLTSAGFKPSYLRIALSAGAAHMRFGTAVQDTSTTAVTSDTIISSNEALWLHTLGFAVVAFRQAVAAGGTIGAVASVTPLEEGALRPPVDSSGLG